MFFSKLSDWQADYRPSAYLLAFSGGRDSVAMLDWLARFPGQSRQARIAEFAALPVPG